jgi:hypothetical protein
MTYLELCQMTAQQSGTIEGTLPSTVTGQVRRLKLITDFVREAYDDIQNAHRMWRWMQSLFYVDTVASQPSYASSAMTDEITALPVTRWSNWGFKNDGSDRSVSMYLVSTGVAEEGVLQWMDWTRFNETQLRGTQTPGRPIWFSVTPDDKLIVSPQPDDIYRIRGPYRKSKQTLAADADVPEMPADFHTIIKDAALCYVEAFDEGPRIPVYRLRMLPNWSMLESSQLPRMTWGAPLA